MEVQTELIVPKRNGYSWSRSRNDERETFKEQVKSLLSKELTSDWEQYIKLSWTDSFFVIEAQIEEWTRKKLKSFKVGKEFILSAELANTLKETITEIKQARGAKEAHIDKFRSMRDAIKDAVKVDNDVSLSLDRETFSLEIQIKLTEGYGDNVKCKILTDGTITEPAAGLLSGGKTISSAKAFIETFQPLHDRMVTIANDVKSKLPKEFWDTAK